MARSSRTTQTTRRRRAPRPKRPSLPRRLFGWGMKAGAVLGLVGALILAGAFLWFSQDLPNFDTLEDYRPVQTTRVVSADGEVVGEFFEQRRTVVPFEEIPEVLIQAIVAAEDGNFYEHEGLDYVGILRAAVKNVLAMRAREGASTITQQTVKTFLLSPEKRFSRKIKEAILARRLERNLSKDEILYLYLNQIYFGHGRYGVEEASRFYFGKPVREITLAEAAVLAGLPKSPAYLSPRRHPDEARKRRAYVLNRMVDAGFIESAAAEAASAQPIVLAPRPEPPVGAWYLEEVRRRLEVELGSELLLSGGLTVRVAMDTRLQAAAEAGLAGALEALDHRQGWRGPVTHLDGAKVAAARTRLKALAEKVRTGEARPWVWDLADMGEWSPQSEEAPPVHLVPLTADAHPAGLVVAVDAKAGTAVVDLGTARVDLALKQLTWARPFDLQRRTAAPGSIAKVVTVGDVVRVAPSRLPDATLARIHATLGKLPTSREALPKVAGTLYQTPQVEGAFVAIDPDSRQVLALVGGYDADASRFNRATQARRQPGSTFKPFVYGTALESGRYTPNTPVLDAPAVFRDPWTGKTWKPANASQRFDGELPLRTALARSKNLVSVRLVSELGVDPVIDFATRAGIRSELPRVLPLALGAGEVSPLELVNAYATFATLGVRDEPVMILEVVDAEGRVLRAHTPQPEQVIRPGVAWVLLDMMQDVMREGTGRSLDKLGRPVAGKTGTANDQRDGWFVGVVPGLVAGAWVGFDEPKPLGPGEYGARVAGPAWLTFMQEAVKGRPAGWFDAPDSVVFARVDPDSGLLAQPGHPGRFMPFVAGTEPTETAPLHGLAPADYPLLDPEFGP